MVYNGFEWFTMVLDGLQWFFVTIRSGDTFYSPGLIKAVVFKFASDRFFGLMSKTFTEKH